MGQLPTRQTVPASWVNRSLGLLATVALGYAPVAPADAQVGVRCADHGAYFRVVLDLPADGKLTVSRSPGTVRLGWPKEWTLAGAEKCLRSIQGLDGLERKGGKDLVLSYSPAGLKARTMSLADPPRWVVDVGRVGQTEEGRARSGESASKEPDGGGGSHPGGNYSGVPLPPAIPPEPPKELAEYRKRVARGGVNEVEKELGDKARGGKKLPASLGFLLGNLYQRQARDLDAAQALWHTARDHPGHPYSPEALRTAAAIYNRLGFHYEGAKPLEAFLRNYPRDPQRPLLQLRLGRLYALSNDPGAARQELVPLLYQGPEGLRPRARLWLAYLLDSAGEYAEAADKFRTARRQATKYFNSHPELMVAAGQADLMAGKANEAEGLLKEFTRRFHTHPRKVEAMVLRGQALARMGEWHQALGLYRQVLGGDAQADLKARARAGIVEALHALGNLNREDAVARLDAIASSLPFSRASWEARQTAARLQEGAKRYGAALTQLGPLLGQGRPPERKRLRKEVDRLLPKAIRAELQDDNPFEGYKLFNRYAGKHPPPQAGRYAFRSLLELGALKAAHRVLDRFRGTYGETIRGKRWEYELARAYRQLGDPAGLDWIDALLDKQPAHPWASRLRLEKARLLKGLGRNGKLLRYLDAHPGLPAQPAGKLRAEALKAEKKPQQAYRALVRLDRGSGSEGLSGPLNAEAGDLAARIGKIYEARDYWKKALKAGVPDWQARQLRALLGVDALQREDFAGAREYLKGVKGDGPFARTAAIYSDLMPLIREQLH